MSSIAGLVFFGGLAIVLRLNRPDRRSFEEFFLGKSRLVRLMGRMMMPGYQFVDLVVASLVIIDDDGRTFLGLFGTWIPLSWASEMAPKAKAPEESLEVEVAKRKALRLKGEKRWEEALGSFLLIAKANGDPDCWLEAANCAQICCPGQSAVEYRLKAAEAYVVAGKPLRAANLYEALGGIENLRQAISLYKELGDGRADSLQADLGEELAKAGQWSEAGAAFRRAAEQAAKDSLLIPLAQRRMFLACLCSLGGGLSQPAWPAWFADSPEATLLSRLSEGDSEVERPLGKMAALPSWATQIIQEQTSLR